MECYSNSFFWMSYEKKKIFNYLHDEIFNFYKNDYPVVSDKLNQLNNLCDDYDFMLLQFNENMGYDIHIYITRKDVDISLIVTSK